MARRHGVADDDAMPDLWMLCRNGPAIEEREVDGWLLRRLDGLDDAGVCERASLWRVARLEGTPAGWDGWLLEIRGMEPGHADLDGLLEELRLLGLKPTVFTQDADGVGPAASRSSSATPAPR